MAITTTFTLVDNVTSKIDTIINRVSALGQTILTLDSTSDGVSSSLSNIKRVSQGNNATMGQLNQKISSATQSFLQMNLQMESSLDKSSKVTKGIGQVNSSLKQLLDQTRITNDKFEKLMTNMATPKVQPSQAMPTWFDNLKTKINSSIQSLTGLYIAFKGMQSFFNFSDKIINIDARLNLITNSDAESKKLKSSIMAVANELGADFTEFSDQVIKIKQLTGDTFSSNGEALKFSELLSKSFKIAGTDAQQSSAALYQLTQALGSGALQGDEFRSIRENAPLLVDAIAKTMHVSKGELKKLGAEGKITAGVIKAAVFNSAEEIETKFAQMPTTWGQMFNILKNKLIIISELFFKVFNSIASNSTVVGIFNDLFVGISVVLGAFSYLLKAVIVIIDILEPFKYLIYSIVGAFVAYNVVVGISTAYTAALASETGILSAVLTTWSIIQQVLNGELTIMNALLNLNPIGLIIAAVVVFIGVLQTAIYAFNKFTGGTKTLLGVIVGSIYAAFGIICNIVIASINVLINGLNKVIKVGAIVAEAIYNMFISPMDSIKNYIISSVNFALGGIKKLVSVADKIVGTNMANSISKVQSNLENKKFYAKGMINLTSNTPQISNLQYMDVGAKWKAGNKLGDSLQHKMTNLFPQNGTNELSDFNNKLGNIDKNLDKIDKNTDRGANKTEEFVEDLKLLRDMAHREYIAEVTAPTVHIQINNDNHINTEQDKEDFIKTLTDKIGLAIGSTAVKGVI